MSNNTNDEIVPEKHAIIKEDVGMLKKLNMEKIKSNPINTISSKEALKDVTPIQWSEDVLSGKKKAVVK